MVIVKQNLIHEALSFFEFNPKKPLACLVSGGIDSMVLLELLSQKRHQFQFSITVVHFNHHLRGDESNRDEQFVRAEARRRDLPIVVRNLPIPEGSGIQNRARQARRMEILKLAEEYGWKHFFLAHHLDDQIETVVMRFIRGAGERGLRGMEREVELQKGIWLIRPFLQIPKNELGQYARTETVASVEDSSNNKEKYWRNRVRRKVIPKLKELYPDLSKAVAEDCQQLQEGYRLVEAEAEGFLSRYPGSLSVGRFFTLSPSARFLILEKKMRHAGFDKEVQRYHVSEIEGLLRLGKRLEREYGPARLSADEGFFDFI